MNHAIIVTVLSLYETGPLISADEVLDVWYYTV